VSLGERAVGVRVVENELEVGELLVEAGPEAVRRLAVAVVLGPDVLELGPVGEIRALRDGDGDDGHPVDPRTR
jgi:hypothetical protein